MKRRRIKHIWAFLLSIFLILVPVFAVQFFYYEQKWRKELFFTYAYNGSVTLLFLVGFLLKERVIKPYLGYYFLYFSLFKFGLFLFAVEPFLGQTSTLKSHTFFSFFVPYAICLFLEVRFIMKELNSSEY